MALPHMSKASFFCEPNKVSIVLREVAEEEGHSRSPVQHHSHNNYSYRQRSAGLLLPSSCSVASYSNGLTEDMSPSQSVAPCSDALMDSEMFRHLTRCRKPHFRVDVVAVTPERRKSGEEDEPLLTPPFYKLKQRGMPRVLKAKPQLEPKHHADPHKDAEKQVAETKPVTHAWLQRLCSSPTRQSCRSPPPPYAEGERSNATWRETRVPSVAEEKSSVQSDAEQQSMEPNKSSSRSAPQLGVESDDLSFLEEVPWEDYKLAMKRKNALHLQCSITALKTSSPPLDLQSRLTDGEGVNGPSIHQCHRRHLALRRHD